IDKFNNALSRFETAPRVRRRIAVQVPATLAMNPVCAAAGEIHDSNATPASPLLRFNEARCREYSGRIEASVQYLQDFLQSVQNSPMAANLRDRVSILQTIARYESPSVRNAYAEFARSLDTRNYRAVL